MKTARQITREARELYRFCLVDGALDEARVRSAVRGIIDAGRPGGLAVLKRFQRLVRLDQVRHSAEVESAAPLASDVRERIVAALRRLYGPRIVAAFVEKPDLLGGVRVKVGSDVYDGSVRGGLSALEARF
jgi:F-type H+-transporting ATPase subunit delta